MIAATNSRALSSAKATTRQAAFTPAVRPARQIQTRAVDPERSSPPFAASFVAATAAAVLLVSAPAQAAPSPQYLLANEGPGLLERIWKNIPKAKAVQEDPFGADRAQERTIADTKNPIPIPTEQEAVAPEAFPNPSANRFPTPPVLSSAAGDEQRGPNANQFEGLKASDRQRLIDEASPAQSSNL